MNTPIYIIKVNGLPATPERMEQIANQFPIDGDKDTFTIKTAFGKEVEVTVPRLMFKGYNYNMRKFSFRDSEGIYSSKFICADILAKEGFMHAGIDAKTLSVKCVGCGDVTNEFRFGDNHIEIHNRLLFSDSCPIKSGKIPKELILQYDNIFTFNSHIRDEKTISNRFTHLKISPQQSISYAKQLTAPNAGKNTQEPTMNPRSQHTAKRKITSATASEPQQKLQKTSTNSIEIEYGDTAKKLLSVTHRMNIIKSIVNESDFKKYLNIMRAGNGGLPLLSKEPLTKWKMDSIHNELDKHGLSSAVHKLLEQCNAASPVAILFLVFLAKNNILIKPSVELPKWVNDLADKAGELQL